MLKYNIDYSLDCPERTLVHRDIIKSKKFLAAIYKQWYSIFLDEIKTLPEGKIIELGSGGGFFKELAPQVICSDVIDLPTNDMTFSALQMPFEDQTLGGIFMVDTMHHIPDSNIFLQEVDRVLKKGGKMVMVEPANSLWGKFIYKNFHHEPFEPKAGWTIDSHGPLSDANGALPWIVFVRDNEDFKTKFPSLKIECISYSNPLTYLLSGGVSRKQFLPDFMFGFVQFFDKLLPKISRQFSMFMIIKVIKI
jgi:SAM-dependent methyltransferase